MHIKGLLHKVLTPVMHKKRLATLIVLIEGLLYSKKLSVTGLGRSILLNIQERSGIRRADRFVGNSKLPSELEKIYEWNIKFLIACCLRPKIIADWSHVPNTTHHVLRAAWVAKGRALTLYEETHPEEKLGNVSVESKFLNKLHSYLPETCRPIIITDAGFRNPWFREVLKLNWDFIGRIRGTHVYSKDGVIWKTCASLLSKATSTAKCIGKIFLCKKSNTLQTFLFLFKDKSKMKFRKIKKSGDKDEKNYRRSAKEGWLLASSLPGSNRLKINRVIKTYRMRMQIEEGFRDLKCRKFGFSFRDARSRSLNRIRVLLIIAMLAALVAWLVGYLAENEQWHYHFQSNSIKNKRVVSLFFLGCLIIKRKIKITLKILENTIKSVRWELQC